jgi:ATP-dependent DNA helicase PIF1
MLSRIALNPDDETLLFPMQRLQFPVKLACMTINKAQGQSLSRVAIHLIDDVSGHGQLYVAVSRAIAKSRLKIYIGDGVVDDGRPVTIRNVVYHQAFKV